MTTKSSNSPATSLQKISCFDLRQRINALKTADLTQLTVDQIKHRVARIIDQYPLQVRKLEISGMYRAQKNAAGEIFTNAKRLWYPPSSVVKKPGRLNNIGQSRFYAASMPNTTLLEMRPTIGDIFTVLVARTKDETIRTLNVAFIGIERSCSFELEHLTERDIFRRSPSFRESLGEANYKKWLLIDDYLSSILGTPVKDSEEYKYKPTIALAELLFSCQFLDAINYPSVATQDHGINICMLPEKVDEMLITSDAWMIRVEAEDTHPTTGEKLQRISFLRRSREIAADGTIDWLPEGVGLDTDNIARFVRRRLQNLAEFPKPYAEIT